MLTVEPTELTCEVGGGPRELRITNTLRDRAVAWAIKPFPPCLAAQHRFEPAHEGFLAPLATVALRVALDDTVRPDPTHKDKLLIVAVPLETGDSDAALATLSAHRSVADFLGNASHKVFKLKVTVTHPGVEDPSAVASASASQADAAGASSSSSTTLPVEEVADLEPRTVVEHILRHVGSRPLSGGPCTVLFAAFFGSRAYNLTIDDGKIDTDVYGVFLAPLRDVLSVRTHISAAPYDELLSGQRGVACQGRSEELDFTIRELGNFCSLLVLGSPNAVEMLYVDRSECYATEAWWSLAALRDRFMTRRFLLNYLGWASAALHSLRRQRVLHLRRKAVCHAMRIVATARGVLDATELCGPRLRVEGPLRDEILSIKRGERDAELDSLAARTRNDITAAEARVPKCLLPESVSNETVAMINEELFNSRMK